jgi:uncharacterized protein (TIGR02996 family)
MIDALAAAEAALSQGERAEALDRLLEAWRAQKAPQLAALIDVVSSDLGRSLSPLDVDAKDFHAAWMAVEANGSAADVPRLAVGLCAEPTSTLAVRVERLVARGDDPRTGRALLAMVDRIPTTSSSNFPVWVRAFAAMTSMLDTSVSAELEAFRARPPKTKSQFWPKFHKWIDKLVEALPEPAALDKDDTKRVKAMLATARQLAKAEAPEPRKPGKKAAAGSSPTAALASARDAIRARKWDVAIARVLEAWSSAPGPELAKLLAQVSEAAPREELPVAPAKAVGAAWDALEKKGRPCDVPSLLDRLEVGAFADIESRLARLAARPADPRVSARMRQIVHEGKAGGEKTAYWAAVFDLLARAGNAADLDVAQRLGKDDASAIGRGNLAFGNGRLLKRNGGRVAEAMRERLAHEAKSPAAPAILGAIAEIEAILPAQADDPERALVAAILASPDDDAPRLVYADKLTEMGNPRGELIVVQCELARDSSPSAKRKKLESREKALLKARKELLGPLAEISFQKSERFERGLLVKLAPQVKSERQFELLDHPMLATLRELDLMWTHDGASRLALHPNLAAVRKITGLDEVDLPAVFGSPRPLAIEHLEFGMQRPAYSDADRAAIAEGRGVPALRVLRASFWDSDGLMPPWMMGGAMVKRLTRLDIGGPSSSQMPAIADWLRALAEFDLRLPVSLEWGDGGCTIVDGVMRATHRSSKASLRWASALSTVRPLTKELVLDGPWPAEAKAQAEARS